MTESMKFFLEMMKENGIEDIAEKVRKIIAKHPESNGEIDIAEKPEGLQVLSGAKSGKYAWLPVGVITFNDNDGVGFTPDTNFFATTNGVDTRNW